jgi:hypothetical protein
MSEAFYRIAPRSLLLLLVTDNRALSSWFCTFEAQEPYVTANP